MYTCSFFLLLFVGIRTNKGKITECVKWIKVYALFYRCSPQLCFAPCTWCKESKTVFDSGFHAVDSGFQLLDSRSFSGFLPFQLLVGFGISTAVFRIPQANLFKIPDSTCENLAYSGIPHGQICFKCEGANTSVPSQLARLRFSNTLAHRFSSQRV